jgi:hypothetical protein
VQKWNDLLLTLETPLSCPHAHTAPSSINLLTPPAHDAADNAGCDSAIQDQYFNYVRMPFCARIAGTNGLTGMFIAGLPLTCLRTAPGACRYITSTAICVGNAPEPIVVGGNTIHPTCRTHMLSIDGVPAVCDTSPLYG